MCFIGIYYYLNLYRDSYCKFLIIFTLVSQNQEEDLVTIIHILVFIIGVMGFPLSVSKTASGSFEM